MNALPLILEFCLPRKNDIAPVFTYDSNLNLNVFQNGQNKVPFITNKGYSELETKTFVDRESDDDDINTRVQREHSNEYVAPCCYQVSTTIGQENDDDIITKINREHFSGVVVSNINLMTMTAVDQENDDDIVTEVAREHSCADMSNYTELLTKTAVNRESDDEEEIQKFIAGDYIDGNTYIFY